MAAHSVANIHCIVCKLHRNWRSEVFNCGLSQKPATCIEYQNITFGGHSYILFSAASIAHNFEKESAKNENAEKWKLNEMPTKIKQICN